jgi:OOP family OmpA-OmpF porin
MRSMKFLVLPLLLLPLGTMPSHAGDDELSRLYLGAGAGISRLEPDLGGTPYAHSEKNRFGWKLFAGYDVNERISVEGYYANLNEAELSPWGDIGYESYGASALYYFSREGEYLMDWSLFANLGMGKMGNSASVPYEREHDFHLMYGAGLERELWHGVSLRLQGELYDKDAHLYSVSLVKRFGAKKAEPVIAPVVVSPPPEPVVEPQPVVLDSDGDGVLDDRDACPHSAPGVKVDEQGCKLQEVITLRGVVFASNSATLIGDSEQGLDEVVATLLRYPEQRVEVAGYTDNRGSRAYNEKLSQRRAKAVRSYLVEHGVAAGRLTARGYGPENPVADNETAEGRALNRRVELHLLEQQPPAESAVPAGEGAAVE